MKVSHESPLRMLEFSREYNDYDYALVHLFESNKEYYKFFEESLNMGREVILDNSIFELGEAFDMERFLYWINMLHPTYYIIPDVLDDAQGTIDNYNKWMTEYAPRVNYRAKVMAVCQGQCYEDIVLCYKTFSKVDKIAFSFNSSFFGESANKKSQLMMWMVGRQQMIFRLLREGVIDETKEHHLLGCALPQEFSVYKYLNFITTCDTSNPVVHGLYKIKYTEDGLRTKEDTKLCDLLDATVNIEQYGCITHNVEMFKKFANDEGN